MPFFKSFANTSTGWTTWSGSLDGSLTNASATNCMTTGNAARVKAVSSSLIACCYSTGTTGSGNLRLTLGSVSGNAITFGTEVTVDSGTMSASDHADIAILSSTKIAIAWTYGGGTGIKIRTYTISGTTLTADVSATTVGDYTTASDGVCVVAMSATRFLIAAAGLAGGITVGSGTVTADASVYNAGSSVFRVPQMVKVSSSRALVAGYGTGLVNLYGLSDSGTLVTGSYDSDTVTAPSGSYNIARTAYDPTTDQGLALMLTRNVTSYESFMTPYTSSTSAIVKPAGNNMDGTPYTYCATTLLESDGSSVTTFMAVGVSRANSNRAVASIIKVSSADKAAIVNTVQDITTVDVLDSSNIYMDCDALSSTKAVIGYAVGGQPFKAKILRIV